MNATWERPCWEYTPDFIDSYLGRPSGDRSLSLGLFEGDRLVAYEAMVPYEFGGERIVQTGFWTADPEFSGRAVGFRVFRELVTRAKERGYAGFLAAMEAGKPAEGAFRFAVAKMRPAGTEIQRFRQLVARPHTIRSRLKGNARRCERYAGGEESGVLSLFEDTLASVTLARTIPVEDLGFILRERPNCGTWIWRSEGRIRGLVNAIRVGMIRAEGRVQTSVLDHVLIDEMPEPEIRQFFGAVFANEFWNDVEVVTIPRTGYFDPKRLRPCGFIAAPQTFKLFWTPFEGSGIKGPIESSHIDLL